MRGNAYVVGATSSTDFPTTSGAVQATLAGSSDIFVAKVEFVGPPHTLALSPAVATNPVHTQHCVTATVLDVSSNPAPDITVRFGVAGATALNGSAISDASGHATFCYLGPATAGVDAITAYADTNENATRDVGEPSDDATKKWFVPLPTSTDECRKGGWQTFGVFKNQGDCVSFVSTRGKNAPSDLR